MTQTSPIDEVTSRTLADLLADVLVLEHVQPNSEVGLHLVDTAEISELNAQHMGVEGPTDVLSFPVDGATGGDAVDNSEDPDGPPALVGDVVVCVEVAAANAPEHAGTTEAELCLLVVHAALHLCGWDHESHPERIAMWGRERELMAQLDVSPPLDPWGGS